MRYVSLIVVIMMCVLMAAAPSYAMCGSCEGSGSHEHSSKAEAADDAVDDEAGSSAENPIESERVQSGETYDETTGTPDLVESDTAGEAH